MSRLNTDTATILGLWVGIGGFIAGIASIGLTLYSFYKDQPDKLLLTGSGWVAAVLTTLCMGALGKWLVMTIVQLTDDLKKQNIRHEKEIADISYRLAEALAEKKSVIAISEFLATKTIRATTTRKQTSTTDVEAKDKNTPPEKEPQ